MTDSTNFSFKEPPINYLDEAETLDIMNRELENKIKFKNTTAEQKNLIDVIFNHIKNNTSNNVELLKNRISDIGNNIEKEELNSYNEYLRKIEIILNKTNDLFKSIKGDPDFSAYAAASETVIDNILQEHLQQIAQMMQEREANFFKDKNVSLLLPSAMEVEKEALMDASSADLQLASQKSHQAAQSWLSDQWIWSGNIPWHVTSYMEYPVVNHQEAINSLISFLDLDSHEEAKHTNGTDMQIPEQFAKDLPRKGVIINGTLFHKKLSPDDDPVRRACETLYNLVGKDAADTIMKICQQGMQAHPLLITMDEDLERWSKALCVPVESLHFMMIDYKDEQSLLPYKLTILEDLNSCELECPHIIKLTYKEDTDDKDPVTRGYRLWITTLDIPLHILLAGQLTPTSNIAELIKITDHYSQLIPGEDPKTAIALLKAQESRKAVKKPPAVWSTGIPWSCESYMKKTVSNQKLGMEWLVKNFYTTYTILNMQHSNGTEMPVLDQFERDVKREGILINGESFPPGNVQLACEKLYGLVGKNAALNIMKICHHGMKVYPLKGIAPDAGYRGGVVERWGKTKLKLPEGHEAHRRQFLSCTIKDSITISESDHSCTIKLKQIMQIVDDHERNTPRGYCICITAIRIPLAILEADKSPSEDEIAKFITITDQRSTLIPGKDPSAAIYLLSKY